MSEPRGSSVLPEAGEVIGEKYRILRSVGQGGVGVVFEAEHLRLEQRVAIKMILPSMKALPEVVKRFEREARATAKLRSAYVARVFDVDRLPDGTPYIVMEFLNGRDLTSELNDRGPLPIPEAVDVVLQACAAMSEAHQAGIIHRDLKPANLFLNTEGGRRILKVVDFGISKSLLDGDIHMTMTATTLGTPAYMSPEQVRSAKHVDARTDIWSLGVILYRLISGKLPFGGGGTPTGLAVAIATEAPRPLAEVCPEAPRGLIEAISTALTKDMNGRFATVEALAAAIAPFGTLDLRSLGLSVGPPAPLSRRLSHPSLPGLDESKSSPTGQTLENSGVDPPSSHGHSRSLIERKPPAAPLLGSKRFALVSLGVALLALAAAAALALPPRTPATRPAMAAESASALAAASAPAASASAAPSAQAAPPGSAASAPASSVRAAGKAVRVPAGRARDPAPPTTEAVPSPPSHPPRAAPPSDANPIHL